MTDSDAFVLVPGAGGDGRLWEALVDALRHRAVEAVPVTLPAGDDRAGWREYADAIVSAADERRGVVLVAQSLAGFSATLACQPLRARILVLLNAMIPVPGETGMDWWSDTGQAAAQRAYLESIGLTPEEAQDDRILYFHDVPDALTANVFARGEPSQTMTPMYQPWPMDRWPDVPTVVLAGRDDRLFPATFQQRIARERLGLEAEVIHGGHMAAMSRPEELADRLVELARH